MLIRWLFEIFSSVLHKVLPFPALFLSILFCSENSLAPFLWFLDSLHVILLLLRLYSFGLYLGNHILGFSKNFLYQHLHLLLIFTFLNFSEDIYYYIYLRKHIFKFVYIIFQNLILWEKLITCPWNSPGKHTWVGCHFLLQAIFPTQGLNLGLLHYRQILYHLSHKGTRVQSLDWEDRLEKGMATHSSILSWRIQWTEPSRLHSMGLQRVGHNLATNIFTFTGMEVLFLT